MRKRVSNAVLFLQNTHRCNKRYVECGQLKRWRFRWRLFVVHSGAKGICRTKLNMLAKLDVFFVVVFLAASMNSTSYAPFVFLQLHDCSDPYSNK